MGLETVLAKSPKTKIFFRKQTIVKPLRLIPNNPRVGMATSAFFEGTKEQIELITRLKEKLKIQTLKIRLHPNSKLTAKSFPYGLLQIAPVNETVDSFATSLDIAIVGNSAIQLKLLCEELPVIHIVGLDNDQFDIYKYCENKFCFGLQDINLLDLSSVKQFYANPNIQEKIIEYVNIENLKKYQPLKNLRKYVS
jgi:hypothetical protein